MVRGKILVFTKVHETHEISAFVEVASLVGNPNLDAGDVNTRVNDRQIGKPLVVIFTKEMREEKSFVMKVLSKSTLQTSRLRA